MYNYMNQEKIENPLEIHLQLTYLYFITETTVPMQVKVTAETFHHEQFLHVHLDFPHHSIFQVLVHLLSRVTNHLVILV